ERDGLREEIGAPGLNRGNRRRRWYWYLCTNLEVRCHVVADEDRRCRKCSHAGSILGSIQEEGQFPGSPDESERAGCKTRWSSGKLCRGLRICSRAILQESRQTQ